MEICPAQAAVDLFGGKWKTTILYYVEKEGDIRFNELHRKIPKVSSKMLSQQLQQLEIDGLIVRIEYAEKPSRVEYSLTELGKSLVPVFTLICEWGEKHLKLNEETHNF